MEITTAIVLALVYATTILAQSSPGAPFDVGTHLPAFFNNTIKVQPGALFSPNQVVTGPTYGAANTNSTAVDSPFMVVLIDINVALNASNPSNQSQYLHVLQPNLYISNPSMLGSALVFNPNGNNASSVIGAPYFSPIPPVGLTHNYNMFLFNQPANFTMPTGFARFNQPSGIYARIDFNITLFASLGGLGQPIAANYFRVLNGTAAQSSVVQSQTATSGVAFPTGYMFSSVIPTASGMSSMTASSTGSAITPASSKSSAWPESGRFEIRFLEGACFIMAALSCWLW